MSMARGNSMQIEEYKGLATMGIAAVGSSNVAAFAQHGSSRFSSWYLQIPAPSFSAKNKGRASIQSTQHGNDALNDGRVPEFAFQSEGADEESGSRKARKVGSPTY